MNYEILEEASTFVRQAWPEAKPRCGLILGSGWSEVAQAFDVKDSISYELIPGLGAPGVKGHAGQLVYAEHAGIETLIFQGRRHWYEGEGWTPIGIPIYILKNMGASILVVTNAAGGVRDGFSPGTLMTLDDHINMMSTHPLIGPHDDFWGPRFPDQTHVYDPAMRDLLLKAAKAAGVNIEHGVYLAGSGPTYETPAEIRAFRTMGADAVGMSTVPEAMLANAAGFKVVAISCITNFAAGIQDTPLSHEEVTAAANEAMPRMKKLLLQFWKELANSKAVDTK